MNTPLKFDPLGQPNFQLEHSDLRSHHEHVAWDTVPSIWRHKRLISLLVAAALALASLAIPLMPRKYSAEAIVYPNLFSREQGRPVALASIDAASLVNGEARLIRSDAILRAVAKRVGDTRSFLHGVLPRGGLFVTCYAMSIMINATFDVTLEGRCRAYGSGACLASGSDL
jgi:hypothetical protein